MSFRKLLFSVLVILSLTASAQQERETDSLIVKKLSEWQDLKFGFMIHWGFYSQWGVVESWSICSEPWIDRHGVNYVDYVRDYQALNKTFNPIDFDPDYWASVASEAGMRYVVFTAKHHDGFCMFDTKETSYSITDASCPFSSNKYADVTAALLKAFRKKNFMTGLYFSKADWHHQDYWAPEWATPDRNVNYDPSLYPERWQRFCDFTYNQIKELTHNYGDIDILWLDGGWIRPENSLTDEYRQWLGCNGWIQDIDMPKIAAMARENNPDLIIVDRTVHGKYENYMTPEQQIPDTLLPYPWETCMSMGNSWSYNKNDEYKSTNVLIHYIVDIVAKGGNFLLNVGPGPDGKLPEDAVKRMKEIGAWMRVNGDAIYDSRPVYPYSDGNLRYTQGKDGTIYAIVLLEEDELFPHLININGIKKLKTGRLKIKGSKVKAMLSRTKTGYQITVDEEVPLQHAVVIEMKK